MTFMNCNLECKQCYNDIHVSPFQGLLSKQELSIEQNNFINFKCSKTTLGVSKEALPLRNVCVSLLFFQSVNITFVMIQAIDKTP